MINTVFQSDITALGPVLGDNSVDMIFTDPPYDRASVPLYTQLAELSARVLKPGKFCLAMAGGLYNPEILEGMSKSLAYYFTFHVYFVGRDASAVRPRGNPRPVITRLKAIHAFVKDWGSPRVPIQDPYIGGGNDKRFHRWGQDTASARYYIDCFTNPGDLVLDPFCGGGTTPFVSMALDRSYIASDIDPVAVQMTQDRLRNPLFVPEIGDQLRMAFVE